MLERLSISRVQVQDCAKVLGEHAAILICVLRDTQRQRFGHLSCVCCKIITISYNQPLSWSGALCWKKYEKKNLWHFSLCTSYLAFILTKFKVEIIMKINCYKQC